MTTIFNLLIANAQGHVRHFERFDNLECVAIAFSSASFFLEHHCVQNSIACVLCGDSVLANTVVWLHEEGELLSPRISVTSDSGRNAIIYRLFAKVWSLPQFKKYHASLDLPPSLQEGVLIARDHYGGKTPERDIGDLYHNISRGICGTCSCKSDECAAVANPASSSLGNK